MLYHIYYQNRIFAHKLLLIHVLIIKLFIKNYKNNTSIFNFSKVSQTTENGLATHFRSGFIN